MTRAFIEMKNICKQFNGQHVLKNAHFSIQRGEVCSILGENGAGKTTLMKILAGVISQDSGQIFFDEEEIPPGSIAACRKRGIYMIFQEPKLIRSFSVEKNLFLGNEIRIKNTPIINKKLHYMKAKELLDYLKADIDVNAPIGELSHAQRKIVEIAKALLLDVQVLILDEVTAPFSDTDLKNFFTVIETLKNDGVAVVFISHNIEEVIQNSDRIIILRDGETVEEKPQNLKKDVNLLIEKMAGEDYVNRYPKTRAKKGKKILELQNVSSKKRTIRNADLYLRTGEIVGFAGLRGAGKTTLAKMISGIEPIAEGRMLYNNQSVSFKLPYHAIKKGIAYFSEYNERNIHMLMDAPANITISNLNGVKRLFYVCRKLVIDVTHYFLKHLNFQIPDERLEAQFLSRGTQQKLAISKWLFANANVLVMDEPSLNLDIKSKVELYNIMNRLSHKGKSIIIASSDLRELLGMCDRIYVFRAGKIVAELNSKDANSVQLLKFALGNIAAP